MSHSFKSTRCPKCDKVLTGRSENLTCRRCNQLKTAGKPITKASHDELRQRIASRREAERRLIAWIASCRIPDEQGLGDTAERLLITAKERGKAELASTIKNLLQTCDCQRELRQTAWNERHPYPET